MTVAKLTVCNTFGDPIDPRSWSGTSRNICDALNAKGRLGALVDGLNFASPQIMKGFMTASWLRYAGSYQHERGWVIRRRSVRPAERTATVRLSRFDLQQLGNLFDSPRRLEGQTLSR
jgi:hypothetical protein